MSIRRAHAKADSSRMTSPHEQCQPSGSRVKTLTPHTAATEYDLVIGSRYVKGSSVDASWSVFRKLLSWFGNAVYVPTLLNIPIRDATGGFKLWRRQTLIGLDLDRIASNGYISQVETTYIAYRLGYKINELPIHFPERTHGTSN